MQHAKTNESKDDAMRYTLSALVGAAALAIGLAAGPATAEDAGIIVYNAQHESLAKEWAEGFTKETGIKVTLRNGGDSDFSNQIVAEGAASPADVFLTENSPAMVLVENAGLFAPVDADTLAQVPQDYQATSGKWVGVAARSTVFAYNTTKLKAEQLPKSLLDLADPSWKGRWAASPSGADFQAIVSALLQLKGEAATADWLKAMKENFTAYKGNSTVMKAVNAGEIDGGVIYHYYYFGDQAKTGENSKNVALHYFKNQDPGAFVSVSGGGVLASSKHQKEAQAFLKWVTGKGGQDVLKNGNSFEYAVGKGAESNPKLVPLADLQAPKVDATTLNSKKVSDLMTAAGLL
ncbi:iron ABC transporter substrate-binding protein [Mesorhizobium sp. 131-3-5]|nr:iron ABC transporter substrate-binding protein [Mesorhizobium sp. 131-2-5]BCH07349.1 iron ABC transporter substrate-binding protein [Mesorhizobium sp. 131-3-5]